MNWLGHLIRRHIEPSHSILDLGCGIMGATDRIGVGHVGVDAYQPYLEKIKASGPTILMDLKAIPIARPFLAKSYAYVLLLDVLEHLPVEWHMPIVEEAERIATRKVFVYSPDGMMAQEAWDAWGLGHNPLQAHISAVYAEDFRNRGYEISLHTTENSAGTGGKAFLAIKDV